ncbi:MAG: hypothetical protein AB7L76_17445 [Burkholderiaceae bacterium]
MMPAGSKPTCRRAQRPCRRRGAQRGATILIALILLLALAIAAVATVRSSDSSVLVAGNVAVRMDAVNQAELGVAAAVQMARERLATATANSNQLALNYVAAPLDADDGGIPNVLARDPDDNSEFKSAKFRAVYQAPAVPTQNGVVVNYLIERMCDPLLANQAPRREFCHVAVDLHTPSGSSNADSSGARFDEAVVFRVTVRVDQPNQAAPTFAQEYFSVY